MWNFLSLLDFAPHVLTILCGWYMTVSPGHLLFHRLRAFEVTSINFGDTLELSLTADQIIHIPFVRNLLYTVAMPCFGLVVYGITFLRRRQEPDLLLFAIALVPTIFTSLKIICVRKKLFLCNAILYGLASIPLSLCLSTAPPLDRLALIIQITALSSGATSHALNYFRYTHPRAAVLDFQGAYPILMQIYSTRAHVLLFLWHHIDLFAIPVIYLAGQFTSQKVVDAIVIGDAVFSVVLSILATATILQLRMIDLLLPCLTHGKTDQREVKKYIKPIGSIAFGMMASAAMQSMFLFGWMFCDTFRTGSRESYVAILRSLLAAGIIVNGSARLVSWFLMLHPVESTRLGKKL
jgi:hypothetical protein